MLQGDFFYLASFFMMHLFWEQGGIYRHLSVLYTHTHIYIKLISHYTQQTLKHITETI